MWWITFGPLSHLYWIAHSVSILTTSGWDLGPTQPTVLLPWDRNCVGTQPWCAGCVGAAWSTSALQLEGEVRSCTSKACSLSSPEGWLSQVGWRHLSSFVISGFGGSRAVLGVILWRLWCTAYTAAFSSNMISSSLWHHRTCPHGDD